MSWEELFGKNTDLTPLQMGIRAAIAFVVVLVLLRFAGRRVFGMRAPFDNVISMLLGAVMSRAVVGASPYLATVAASAIIVLLYRIVAWLTLKSEMFGRLVKGEADLIFGNGEIRRDRMNRHMLSDKDLMERVRQDGNVDSLSKVDKAYIERDGCISVVKKDG